jgi:hypothetical protein
MIERMEVRDVSPAAMHVAPSAWGALEIAA